MALQLFKLASSPMPSISATTSQVNYQYFHTWSNTTSYETIAATDSVSLKALSTWFDGTGTSITGFKTGQNSNVLCINGVMQQSGLYTISSTKITIVAPAGGLILKKGYPITLQTYNARAAVVVSRTKTFAVS